MVNRQSRIHNSILAFTVICFLFSLPAIANSQVLSDQIDALLKNPGLDHGVQAVLIKSLKTNQVLYERNADNLMIPASNFKLLVSATILEKLGPDFTYKTEVYTSGAISKKGVLTGNVIVKGGGDPVLKTADLADLANQFKASGIVKIDGNVIVDDTMFDNRRLGWAWSWTDLPYYYSAEISALNLNRNTIDVYVYPGKKAGDKTDVRLSPSTNYMTIENTSITSETGSDKTIWISRVLGQNIIRVNGSIPMGQKIASYEESITVEEPALYAGCVFANELVKKGVRVNGSVRSGKLPKDARLVCGHTSLPLSKLLLMLNKPSDNLIAEVFLKTLGAVVKGRGSSDSGADVETGFFKQIGMDMTELEITDGSGLSRLNYISARNLVTLLTYMYSSRNSKIYIDSLPIAGVDGSLRNRMKNTAAQGNVKAKTGYVSRVSSLSGYVTTQSGEPLVFSILMNHHLCGNATATGVQDKICWLLAEKTD